VAAYRADIEIGVKGLRQVELLQRKVKEVSDTITDLAFKRFNVNDKLLKRSQFFVDQERKLLAARTKYNRELQTSVRLAVAFDQKVRRSLAFAAAAQQVRARALPGSSPIGLLPAQAGATVFRRAEKRAARIDSAYARLAAAAEGTTGEFVRIAQEARTFKALPAAGKATVNYFQIAETAARAIDKQNAANARYTAALNKLATAAEGTYSTFTRFNAGMSNIAGLLSPARIAGLLPAGIGGQRALPPARIAGMLPPAGCTTATGGALPFSAATGGRGVTAGLNFNGFSFGPRAQNIALGAGFPLLFGGGPGAVLGGALGGLVPGRGAFAAQIGLSAIGQQIDQFIARTAEAGVALTSTAKTMEFMREKALFSSTAVEDQAIALEEQGEVTKLADLLTKDLAKSIGGEGVRALQNLGDETNNLTKEWNTLTAQLFALVSGPLAAFIGALNSFLGGITTENRLATLRREVTPAQQARLAQITREERGGKKRNVRGGGTEFVAGLETTQVRENILKRAEAEGITVPAPKGRVTSEDIRTITPPKGKTSAVDKAAQEEARMQARLQNLLIETNAIQKQQNIKEKIAQAELVNDKQLAVRLKGEERSQQLVNNLQKALVGVTDERERQALLTKTAAELDAAQSRTADELNRLENERKTAIQDVVNQLDMELLRLGANTDAKKQALEFLEIENKLKSRGIALTDADAKALQDKLAEVQKLSKEQAALNAKLEMEKELYENMANAVASTFSSAFDAAVKGTENLGEALKGLGADLLATIGKMLIMYGIAQALGAAGGTDGRGIFSFLAKGFGFKGAKEGAYWPGGFQAFADGGVVTRPTMGLIGEGGEPEYVIPASKMRTAMSRYSAGARGSGVIPSGGDQAAGGGTGGGVATMEPIDVRYSVERINNVDYVTADQFQAGMAQAAQQGAIQGERRAMRTLTNSAAARGRLRI